MATRLAIKLLRMASIWFTLGMNIFPGLAQAALTCETVSNVETVLIRARALREKKTSVENETARNLLECAYSQSKDVRLLLQLYQVEMALGQWRGALHHYDEIQEQAERGVRIPGLENEIIKNQMAEDLKRIQSRLGRLEIIARDAHTQKKLTAGTLTVDGVILSQVPMEKAVEVDVGIRNVVVGSPGYVSQAKNLDIASIQAQEVVRETFLLRRTPIWKKAAFWAILGSSAAVLAVGLGVGINEAIKSRPDLMVTLVF